ncbi:unnamed protein product, partial [Trichobilharzia regenti]
MSPTDSDDGDKLRKSPKSKRDRSRPTAHRQTPLIKSTKSSPCEEKSAKSHKTKQSLSDNAGDNESSLVDCSNSPLGKFTHRRRSRSEEPSSELRNCDIITPVQMINNYSENVDNNGIIDCVASPDSSMMMNRCMTNDYGDGSGSITESPGASTSDL